MAILLDKNESAIRRGIKTVGVGKKGSQPLGTELIQEILEELKSNRVTAATRGAFFAGLMFKGPTLEEKALEVAFHKGILEDPARLAHALAPDAPPEIIAICQRILNKEELNKETAYRLGQFLFSSQPGDGARGLVASALRVRYETPDEYEGLLLSMQETLEPAFRKSPPPGKPIVQISEPFDGVDHSYLITPLISRYFQQQNFRAIHMVGRNSGPKFDLNLLDVMKALNIEAAPGNAALAEKKSDYGWFYHQALISKAVDAWVELRHQTIKRPFLATLERFLNPAQADIIISSAFHPPYGEKMTTIAERAGFQGSINVRNGIEGTIAFPLKRPAKILCSARQKDGAYLRQELTFDPVEYLGFKVPLEEKIEKPKPSDNARLIELYTKEGNSGNELFDLRVKVTCEGLKQGIEWVKENIS